ncbi:MAG: GNAT family N-acetyltransferase [Burkholderiaceae bacterium]|jgi:predicted GNAT family acetyltransferase
MGVAAAPESEVSNETLANVIWSALTGPYQEPLATGGPLARRYPREFAPFGATADSSREGFQALRALFAPGEPLALFTARHVDPGKAFEVIARKDAVQMIQTRRATPQHTEFSLLQPSDAQEMRALVDLTKPGPFAERTHELGRFLGLREHGRLVAMAGERLRLEGFTEVSAVCTHPEYRGRGLGRASVRAVASGIWERGEIPILHALADNSAAIALYRELDFVVQQELQLTLLRASPVE